MSQEEILVFWEVIISVILSKIMYMYTCPIPNGFRYTTISQYRSLNSAPTILSVILRPVRFLFMGLDEG